ncbi:MAG: GFA family protein [Alphaproteobacteria bacterium]|jgi:hypothetical protein|nr:GFA family protein [Alphaproteobacteria bacterium]
MSISIARHAHMLTGQCQCGAVRIAVPDDFNYALYCHCKGCQRSTGSAFKAFAGIEASKLQINTPEGGLASFGDENSWDVRCKNCGSLLYSAVNKGEAAHVTLGVLDTPPSVRPSRHIYVREKAPWFVITDGLPQSEEMR